MPTNTYVELDKVTLGSATNSITFSSIPSGYTDLIAICSVKATTGSNEVLRAQVNGDTGSNYSYTYLQGVSSGAESGRASNSTLILAQAGNQAITETANTFAPYTVQFMNYSNTTTNKTILARGAGTNQAGASVSLWRNTAAITSIRFYIAAGNFDTGSTFSLYGIASASVGAKATGGIISSDELYYYHTFASTGTFTPLQSLTCDYLVVAGGGGGGARYGSGGGGAGGYLTASGFSVASATNYTVTIGAGGAGSTSSSFRGSVGSNSVFSTITSTGGGGGGSQSETGGNGGSGGGGGGSSATNSGGSASPSGQGNNGGAGSNNSGGNYGAGGGGGGASAVGATATSSGTAIGGNGGNGSVSSITGTSVTYAGGGGGGVFTTGEGFTRSTGGTGGGGAGGDGNNAAGNAPVNGTANLGGGAGGGGWDSNGANGGSGIVIVRYAK